jgi:hypothetical protein
MFNWLVVVSVVYLIIVTVFLRFVPAGQRWRHVAERWDVSPGTVRLVTVVRGFDSGGLYARVEKTEYTDRDDRNLDPIIFSLQVRGTPGDWHKQWSVQAPGSPVRGRARRVSFAGVQKYDVNFCSATSFALIVVAPWAFIAAWRWNEDRLRSRAGICTACGYDLRATPDRCPECGTEIQRQSLRI